MIPSEWIESFSALTEKLAQAHIDLAVLGQQSQRIESLLAALPCEKMRERFSEELTGAGPLKKWLDHEGLTEIWVNSHDSIWLEIHGKKQKVDDQFLSPLSYENFLHRLCDGIGRQFDLHRPVVDGIWRGFRVHILAPPLSQDGPALTLRKRAELAWTLERLHKAGWCRHDELELLKELMSTGKNLLWIGPTGSGKTSALGAGLLALEASQRVLIIEDTDELPVPNSLSKKMLTRVTTDTLTPYTQEHLVRECLRMKPDRIVIGEIRGGEAKDWLLALSTGHKGCMASLHSNHPRRALQRLEMLTAMAAPQWNREMIRQLIFEALDGIVQVEVDAETGQKKLAGIYRISGLESSGLLIENWGPGFRALRNAHAF